VQVSDLLELAEEPGLHIPLAPPSERVSGDGWTMITSLRSATVERVRLGDVERALGETRALARAAGFTHTTWWVGELTTPVGLADRLEKLGLAPDPELPRMTSLTLASPPAGEPGLEVRRVETREAFLQGLDLEWEVWSLPADERAEQRARYFDAWETLVRGGPVEHYVAYVDGEPAGFGRVLFTPLGGLLLGGVVLPAARGRGAYTALVHARWRDAVARGTPRLTVSAGHMSAPILERLGFERIGAVRLLRDSLIDA